MTEQPSAPRSRAPITAGAALIALVGLATATLVTPFTASHEGKINVAQPDLLATGKVLNICYGDTNDVRPGERDTDAECLARLDKQLAVHAAPVLKCTPGLKGNPHQLAAAIDLAYNIGAPAYCGSTVARNFNLGATDPVNLVRYWRAACDAMLLWNKAGGKVLPGLVKRRQDERAMCLAGLAT